VGAHRGAPRQAATATPHRSLGRLPVELRSFDLSTGEFDAVACVYNVVDSYRTRFIPGVFAESLRRGLPPVRWGHDQSPKGVVGEIVDYRDTNRGLEIIGQLLGPGEAPKSRQARDGLRYVVLDEFSVGFERLASRMADNGVVEITKADLVEVSIVQNAAVPGSELIAVRSRVEIAASYGPIGRRLAYAENRGLPREPLRTRPSFDPDPEVDEILAKLGLA
jgi:HK97 family phage prohead protease